MRFQEIVESTQSCPHCGGPVVEYSELGEGKKDACYYKVKASAKVWPSAYASGRLVQCRKKGAANYGNKSESIMSETNELSPDAVRKLQNFLNKNFRANLDVDGILGDLTRKSIDQFMPAVATQLAPVPKRSTRVQGFDVKESDQLDEVDPEINELYEAMDQLAEEMAAKKGVSADLVWETFEAMDDTTLYETAAWRRKEGKNKKGGLNAKGVASYRRENPGSKLQTAVTTKPSKLKPGSKAAKRRKSFCARMGGVKGPMKKPNGKPTRKALALRKWNC